MNKKFLSLLIIVIAAGLTAVYLFSVQPVAPVPVPQANQIPTSTASIRVPVDVFGDTVTIRGKSFVSTSTGAVVSFSKQIDFTDGSANGNVNVSVNNRAIGTVPTDSHALFSFSPDGKYFGFRGYGSVGAYTFDSSLFVIDLKSATIIGISSPHKASDEVIESYAWKGNAVEIISYIVTAEYTENPASNKYYRTTPKELWRYDLATKRYTLLETLPENSTTP